MTRVFVFIALLFFCVSCSTKKDIFYFQDIANKKQSEVVYSSPKIQVNDILNVVVSALNQEAANSYNIQWASNSVNQSNPENMKLQGYIVPSDGAIVMPILGKVNVLGKTPREVEDFLVNMLIADGHIVNPYVRVRILNPKITVLGEVNAPGTYSFTEQGISLLQALGYAGDLSLTANRKDILIIREENGTRTYNHIDLTKTDWFTGPFYYVKQNDVVYVTPNGPKVKSAGYITNLIGVLSVVSATLTLYFLLKR